MTCYKQALNSDSTRCRASHHKCDEKQPRCSRCQRLDLECELSDFIVPSNWCSSVQGAAAADEERPNPASTWEVFNNSITPLPQVTSPKQPPASHTEPPSLDGDKVALIQEFQNGVGKWVDLFDDEQHFQRTVVKRTLESPLLMDAICALTARQVSMVNRAELWKSAAVQYYAESLHHLITTLGLPASSPEDTLSATILLSSYELLVLPGLDHRRHVSGALTLIKSYGCKASSQGLIGAAFWVYARQDLAMALVHECPTMLPPEEWGVSLAEQETREDRLGNKLIWLLAKIVAHTFGKTDGRSIELLRDNRTSLMRELDAWFESLPVSFSGTTYGPPSPEGFVKRWFAIPSTGKSSIHLTALSN